MLILANRTAQTRIEVCQFSRKNWLEPRRQDRQKYEWLRALLLHWKTGVRTVCWSADHRSPLTTSCTSVDRVGHS